MDSPYSAVIDTLAAYNAGNFMLSVAVLKICLLPLHRVGIIGLEQREQNMVIHIRADDNSV